MCWSARRALKMATEAVSASSVVFAACDASVEASLALAEALLAEVRLPAVVAPEKSVTNMGEKRVNTERVHPHGPRKLGKRERGRERETTKDETHTQAHTDGD